MYKRQVSKDYINGKRDRYSNPFRFYLTVSIIFFLIIGFTESYNKFNELQNGGTSKNTTSQIKFDKNGIKALEIDLDSIQKEIFKEINKQDSTKVNLVQQKIDSLKIDGNSKQPVLNIGLKDSNRLSKIIKFQKKHQEIDINNALDSLEMEKTFANRFLYSRTEVLSSFLSKRGETDKFYRQILSYASIALFILLPLFTLFLRIIYIRRKYTLSLIHI